MWKNEKLLLNQKIFREINSYVTSLVKHLVLEIFVQNGSTLCETTLSVVWKTRILLLLEDLS